MHKSFLITASLLGALAVGLGAFAAHGLKQILSIENITIFETAVRYQFYHVFALLVTGILLANYSNSKIKWAGYLFIVGIFLFSGSLYILCFSKQFNWGVNWQGAVTPFGGVCFIAGWCLLVLGIYKKS
jgi:uncharacterized membrane protein YgdD (TMEM256/DUF423 family)